LDRTVGRVVGLARPRCPSDALGRHDVEGGRSPPDSGR